MPDAARAAGVPLFAAAGATDPGRVRDGNEDRLHVDAERGVFVVADGVGGHAAGEVAATIAVDVIARRLERPLWSPAQRVREAITLANNEILTQAQASPEHTGMTCVVTLALVSEHGLTIGHVGDTRLYKLTPDGMVKLTHDHSPVGEREDAGEITESEAMRHPRRNQVFRDIGSTFHEPDDADFVEVIETPFDGQTALLICSDGLSDMVTSAAIEHTVRRHAGNPGRVVEALIQAANDAGGRDNITAVYVEGEGFAHAPRVAGTATGSRVQSAMAEAARSLSRPLGRLRQSRAAWLVAGLLAGLLSGVGATWTLTREPALTAAGRTLVVQPGAAPDSQGTFTSIAAALAQAAARDVVQVEPGEYVESVVLPDGVSLRARVPGSVALVSRPGQAGWIALVASGRLGHRVSGIRVIGRPDARIAVGLRLTGHDIEVDDVSLEGAIDVGIDVEGDGDVTVRASRIADLEGTPLRVGTGARPIVRQNHVVHRAGTRSAATEIAPDATADGITGNLFSGYAEIVQSSPARDAQLSGANVIVRGPARTPATRRRTP